MSPYWSYVLTALGGAGVLLAGSRKRVGWAIGLAVQPLWLVYAVVTGQWGFIGSALLYGGIYLRNWLKWRREAARIMVAPEWKTHREQVRFTPGRYPATVTNPYLIGGQQTVASAVRPPRPPSLAEIVAEARRDAPPAPLTEPPPPEPVNRDRCDGATGYHSTPHRGCVLR